jgi:hypothetical protein
MSQSNHRNAAHLQEIVNQLENNNELLQERLAALELAQDDIGWVQLIGRSEYEFSREGLRQICNIARIMYLKNPLIQRGVNVQCYYVFGQGVTVQAQAEQVDEVVQAFWNDSKNQVELTSHQALMGKEEELENAGNVFFAFFVNKSNGRVRVRTIPFDEIGTVINDPEDARTPWFYRRDWSENKFSADSEYPTTEAHTAYYPDWRYQPSAHPSTIGRFPVIWDTPIYHIKAGGTNRMQFGVPETYAALDWAKAYKSFLEDWATLTKSLSKFAWKLTTPGGKAGVAAATTKLNSTLSSTNSERNPPPAAGSAFVKTADVDMAPIPKTGANVSAEDGRRLLLMVAAALGLPETFFGDASVGSLATAKSLDRPTELKFKSRQTFWADVLTAILSYVVYWAVRSNTLPGNITEEDDGTAQIELSDLDTETGQPISAAVSVEFPAILEHSIPETVGAIVDAATLRGQALAGTIDQQDVSRQLLQALGVADIDGVMAATYPDEQQAPAVTQATAAEAAMVEAVRELRQGLREIKENGNHR